MNDFRFKLSTRPRRGMAMLMIMGVVTVAAIVAYVALGNAALEMQANTYVRARTDAKTAAENGVALASHLLLHPEELDEGYTGQYRGTEGQWVEFGENQAMKIDIVANGGGEFSVMSSGRASDGEGEYVRSTIAAELRAIGEWEAPASLMLSESAHVAPNVSVGDGIAVDGIVTGAAAVSGPVLAENYADYASGAPLPPASIAVAPAPDTLELIKAGYNGGHYMHNGELKQGALLPSSVITTWPGGSKGHVYFYSGATPLRIVSNSTLVIKDTIVVLSGGISLETKKVKFMPEPGLPGLIVVGGMHMGRDYQFKPAELDVRGLCYVSGGITAEGGNVIDVRGALLLHDHAASIGGGDFSSFDVTANSDADVPELTTEGVAYTEIIVESREEVPSE